jgi:hypothetical protein
MSKSDKKKNHYVNNEKFFEEMVKWKNLVIEAENSDEPKPPINNYIGECFLEIANHLSHKPNFINYPYKDEMISDGIENCIMYCHNFNPEKSKNPFSYFTQIIYYAFLRRIEKEKKQSFIKYKLLENSNDGNIQRWLNQNYYESDSDSDSDSMENKDIFSNKEKVKKYLNLNDTDLTKYVSKKKKKK